MNIKNYFAPSQLILAAVFMLIGMVVGYHLKESPKVFHETHAPAIVLPSGGHVAERAPEVEPPKPIKKAAKELKGKLTRAGSVTVKPTQADCPEVTIDFGLVKQKDGSRMVFHTDDGTILKAVDIPVETLTIVKHPKWSAGVIAPIGQWSGAGPVVERHFGKLSVGVAAVKLDDQWQGLATVKVSW